MERKPCIVCGSRESVQTISEPKRFRVTKERNVQMKKLSGSHVVKIAITFADPKAVFDYLPADCLPPFRLIRDSAEFAATQLTPCSKNVLKHSLLLNFSSVCNHLAFANGEIRVNGKPTLAVVS